MKFLNFMIFCFLVNISFAQSPTILWEKTIGTSKNDEASKVILTSDNQLVMVGYTQPEGRYDLDLFLVKMNLEGEVIWKKNYGSEQVENGYDLVEDENGNFIVVGRTLVVGRSNEVWVLKIDENGSIIWERKYGLKNNDIGRSVFLTNNSHIVIGGSQEGEITTFNHAYQLVLDENGNKIKDHTYGGDHFQKAQNPEDVALFGNDLLLKGETCNKLITSKMGGTIFVGNTITKAKKDLATDGWLVRLREDGQIIWDKAFGAIGGDNLSDVLENEKGEIFTIGEYYDKPKTRMDLWVSKFDKNGNVLWENFYGKKDFNSGKAGLSLENDELLVCGYISNRTPTNIKFVNADTISQQKLKKMLSEGWRGIKIKRGKTWKQYYEKRFPLTAEQQKIKTDKDLWLGKIDGNGNLIWEKTFGGNDDDLIFSMILDHEKNLILTGYTRSKGNGLKDVWVMKLKGDF